MYRKRQLRLRLLRGSALLLILTGLFLLNLRWVHRDPPMVFIGDITPVMNFSRVRVEGTLKSDARTLRGGAILYLIADGTGLLPVFLDSECADELPKAGTRVVAAGQLSIGSGNQTRMRVQEASQISVQENPEPVTLRGQVAEIWVSPQSSNAPHRITLATTGGLLEVVHWFKPEQTMVVGDWLEVKGVVGFYRGRMQLKVSDAGDISLQADG